MQRLVIDTNNVVELQGLTNTVTGDAVIDAVVECTIYDGSNVPVTGQIWPLSMQHVSDGLYRGTLDHDLILERGDSYVAKVTAESTGGGQKKTWEIQARAQTEKEY